MLVPTIDFITRLAAQSIDDNVLQVHEHQLVFTYGSVIINDTQHTYVQCNELTDNKEKLVAIIMPAEVYNVVIPKLAESIKNALCDYIRPEISGH